MNLVIDFGNTRIKAAFYEHTRLLKDFVFANALELGKSGLIEENFQHCLISTVTKEHSGFIETLKSKSNLLVFSDQTPIPIINSYKTPQTLGSDRILAAIGSFSSFPNQNVLTIDAGTCIKYNFVNYKNEFQGGGISPGMSMRLKAMHNFTAALPLYEPEEKFDLLLGNDTKTSMLSGAQIGAACEIDEVISRYKFIYPDLKVVLTGGDAQYLSGQLKNPFFANQNNLLLGLNTVLLYNLED